MWTLVNSTVPIVISLIAPNLPTNVDKNDTETEFRVYEKSLYYFLNFSVNQTLFQSFLEKRN